MLKYIIILIFCALASDVSAQVDTVVVIKDKYLSYKTPVKVPPGMSTLEGLKQNYWSNGFFDIIIEEVSPDSFRISNDRRYTIEEFTLTLEGDSILSNESFNRMTFYNERSINEELQKEYSNYVDKGYLNANVAITSFEVDSLNKSIKIQADIAKGDLVTISEIVFRGNRINNQRYLSRVSGFRDSLTSSKENLGQISRNLMNSELFDEVSAPEVYEQDGDYLVLISVRERNLNQLDGLIGFVPDASGQGQIVGDLNISLWNVLRDGNTFELQYQRLKPETSRLELGIAQQWIANIPLTVGVDFSFYQNDTTYQTRNIGLNSSYLISQSLSLNGRIYSQNSTSSNELNFQQEPDGSKQGADLGFTFSNLNRVEVPTKGVHFNLLYGIANKDIESDSVLSFRQQRIESDIHFYFPIAGQSVIAGSLHGFYVIGDGITESDLIRFGGANSFRGYSEEQFTASELLWGDIEYRFLTDRNSYLFVFGAAGYYNRTRLVSEVNTSFAQSDFLYSGGVGLSYKTSIGRLKFSYALSPTETLSNGKVHFGIRTSF